MAGRKNNHYHYAEKFEDMRRKRNKLFIPRRAVFFAALFLLMFGLISTTFAAYVSSDESVNTDDGRSIIVDVRTAKAQKDITLTGANADLAASGYSVDSGAVIYFDTTGWDTSTYSYVQMMIGGNNGNDKYSDCYRMTRVGTSNLFYLSNVSYGSFNQLCFIANSSSWGHEGNLPNSRKTYSHYYTNTWGSGDLTSTKYVFRAEDLSSNDSNISSINNDGYNTLLNSTFNLYAATKKGTGSYEQSTDGGNATQAGTTKNTTNATSTGTYSTGTSSANPAVNYPMIGTPVTLTNSKKTGYKFDDYCFDNINGSNTTGSPINMTSWKDETTNVFARFSEVMHKVKIKSNTPKINSGSTGVTTNTAVVGVATTYTASAPTKSGYTFTNWSGLSSGITKANGTAFSTNDLKSSSLTFIYTNSGTTSTTCELTANYTLNAPTNVSISDTNMKIGDSAVSLNPSSTVPTGITKTVAYTIEDEDGNDASSVASVDSSGNFTASIPGVYTVTISVSGSDGTLTSGTATDTATVTVSPAVPSWTLTMSGFDASGDLNNGHAYGSENNPYLVTLGSNFSFTAAINNPPSDNNYVYTWYNGNGEVLGTGRSLTFGAATASEATTANIEVEVYCVVSYTGASPTTTSGSIEKWYYIKSLIKSFEIPDMQKIYATPNDAKMEIEYNITNATGYDTSLYFSSDNLTFYQVDVANGAFLGAKVGATAVYQYDPSAQMYPLGVKYFYLAMSKTGASAKTDVIHTTVGANSTSATRPVYFINNAALDLSTYRVMAFYIDGNGDLKYQTAQDVFKGIAGKTENVRYRVMIPSDATKVSFAVAKRTKYHIPEDSANAPVYSSDFFYAYTNYVTLEDGKNTIQANSLTNKGTAEDPLYQLTTTYLAYQTTN